jgi:TonB family protein
MTVMRTSHRIAFVLMAWLAAFQTTNAANPDALARAKELYLAASYDEALAVLDNLRDGSPGNTETEVAQYRVFCLLALERGDEARKAIEAIVQADPFYHPPEEETAPRILHVFEDVRRAVLPSLVQRSYAEAKAAFDRKDPAAASQFERVLTLLDDPNMKGSPLSDLRTVASGFRDLSRTLASTPGNAPVSAPPAVQNTAANAGATAPAEASEPAVLRHGLENFRPPVVVSQPMPQMLLSPSISGRAFKGTLEIMIDERGNVVTATLRESIHPLYDQELLRLARTWKFKPAMLNGVPTRFVKVMQIQLVAPKL